METNIFRKGVLTMKKMLLVILIMMVLAFDIYGIFKEFSIEKAKQEADEPVGTVVYVE